MKFSSWCHAGFFSQSSHGPAVHTLHLSLTSASSEKQFPQCHTIWILALDSNWPLVRLSSLQPLCGAPHFLLQYWLPILLITGNLWEILDFPVQTTGAREQNILSLSLSCYATTSTVTVAISCWQRTICHLSLPGVPNQKSDIRDFPRGPVVKNLPANAGDTGLIPGLGRSHMLLSN